MLSIHRQISLRYEAPAGLSGCRYFIAVKTITYAIVFFLLTALCSAHDDGRARTKLNIDEVMNTPVYGASKLEPKIKEAPSFITKYGYRTLGDILRRLTSLPLTNERNYPYAGVRGFVCASDYNNRILVPVDRHGINDNIYSSVSLANDYVLGIDTIEKLGIIRRFGSSLETDFNDPRNKTEDERGYLDLRFDHSFLDGLGLMARLCYDTYKYSGDSIYSGFMSKGGAEEEWWGGELQGRTSLFKKYTLIAGAEYQGIVKQDQKNYYEPYFLTLDNPRTSQG
jgi:hypothetical protein